MPLQGSPKDEHGRVSIVSDDDTSDPGDGAAVLLEGDDHQKLVDQQPSSGFMTPQFLQLLEYARYPFCVIMSMPDGITYHVYAEKNGRQLHQHISNKVLADLVQFWVTYGAPTGVALFALNNMIRWTDLVAMIYADHCNQPEGVRHKLMHAIAFVAAALSVIPFYGMAKHGNVPEVFAVANGAARFCMDHFAWFNTLEYFYKQFQSKPWGQAIDYQSAVPNLIQQIILVACGVITACYLYSFARDEAGKFLAIAGVVPTALLWGHDSLTGGQIILQEITAIITRCVRNCSPQHAADIAEGDTVRDKDDQLISPLVDESVQRTGQSSPQSSSGMLWLRNGLVLIALAGGFSETLTAANNAHTIGIDHDTMLIIAGIAFIGIYATGPLQLVARAKQLLDTTKDSRHAAADDSSTETLDRIWNFLEEPSFANKYPVCNNFLYVSSHALGAIGSWVFYRLGEAFADKISSGSVRAGLRTFFGATSFIPGALISARSTYDDIIPLIEEIAGSSLPQRSVPFPLKACSHATLLIISFSYGLQRMSLTQASRHIAEPWQSMAEYSGFISAFAIAYCVFNQLRQQLVYDALRFCAAGPDDHVRNILLRIQTKRAQIDSNPEYTAATGLQALLTVDDDTPSTRPARHWVTALAIISSALSAYAYYPVGRDAGKHYLSDTSPALQDLNAISTFIGLFAMYSIVTRMYFPMLFSQQARDETQFRAYHWTRNAAAYLATGFAILAPIPPMDLAVDAFTNVADPSEKLFLVSLFAAAAFFSHCAYSYFAMHSSVMQAYNYFVPPEPGANESGQAATDALDHTVRAAKDVDLAKLGNLQTRLFAFDKSALTALSDAVNSSRLAA